MAEYRLNYTANEINQRLEKVEYALTKEEFNTLLNVISHDGDNIVLHFFSIDGNDLYE